MMIIIIHSKYFPFPIAWNQKHNSLWPAAVDQIWKQPRSKIHHSKKTWNYLQLILKLVESFRNLY